MQKWVVFMGLNLNSVTQQVVLGIVASAHLTQSMSLPFWAQRGRVLNCNGLSVAMLK